MVSDREAVATAAAREIVMELAGKTRPVVCLTGGSGPVRLYELLGASPFKDELAWRDIHWFIGDERFVAQNDPLSNIGQARKIFLDRLAPASHVHAIPTDQTTADAAAQAYERELQAFYGSDRLAPATPLFDIVLMGLGPDGHTASLFPGARLDDRGRWTMGVAEANVAPFVPRVTLTLAALASCRLMIFLVSGAAKHDVLARVRRGDDLPATRAHSNVRTLWLVDRAAAGETE